VCIIGDNMSNRINVLLDDDLNETVRRVAQVEHMKLTAVFVQAMEEYLARRGVLIAPDATHEGGNSE